MNSHREKTERTLFFSQLATEYRAVLFLGYSPLPTPSGIPAIERGCRIPFGTSSKGGLCFELPPKTTDVVRIVRKNEAKPEVENAA